jgi:hypothetical protein
MPVSMATMRGPSLSAPSSTTSRGVTSTARSSPLIGASACTCSIAADGAIEDGKIPPRMEPLSRR